MVYYPSLITINQNISFNVTRPSFEVFFFVTIISPSLTTSFVTINSIFCFSKRYKITITIHYFGVLGISKCKYLYRFLSSGVEPLIQSVNRLDWQSLNINNKYKKSLQEDIDSVVELIQEDYKSEILDVVFASIEALIPSNTHYKQSSTSKLDIEVDNLCKGVFVLE